MKDTIEINYDQLLKEYEESLHEKLRNFSTGHDFLETWVPDGNLEESLLGIFEAAQLYQLKQGLRIRLGVNNARLLKEVRLKAQAKEFGEARVELQAQEKVVHFQAREDKRRSGHDTVVTVQTQGIMEKLLTTPTPVAEFGTHFPSRRIGEAHNAYQSALRSHASEFQHRGGLDEKPEETLYAHTHSGSTLRVRVGKTGKITQATFDSKGELETALLEAFCRLLPGLSLQEASEHGVLKLEHRLRDRKIDLGIPGIVTPENSDPMFQVPQTLIRDIFRRFKVDHPIGRNFFTEKVAKDWLSLSDAQKLAKLREATKNFCLSSSLAADCIQVQELQNDTRVIVRLKSSEHSLTLLRLEAHLRESLESQLEVLLGERQDTNKPRENTAKGKDLSS